MIYKSLIKINPNDEKTVFKKSDLSINFIGLSDIKQDYLVKILSPLQVKSLFLIH